jgi:heme exporter protein B
MKFIEILGWIAWKDIISEVRSRENISSMLFFALVVILIFSFSFSMDLKSAEDLMPGIIWVAFAFSGILGLGKSFTVELQNDCLQALRINPTPPGAIYLGKLLGNLIFMLIVEALLFPLFVVFFNLDVVENLGMLLIIFFAGTLGLSSLGTLFSAMTVQIRAREVMLPILLLPLAVPVMIGSVEATRGALTGDPLDFYRHWLELLLIFDVIFTVISFWVFDFILDH